VNLSFHRLLLSCLLIIRQPNIVVSLSWSSSRSGGTFHQKLMFDVTRFAMCQNGECSLLHTRRNDAFIWIGQGVVWINNYFYFGSMNFQITCWFFDGRRPRTSCYVISQLFQAIQITNTNLDNLTVLTRKLEDKANGTQITRLGEGEVQARSENIQKKISCLSTWWTEKAIVWKKMKTTIMTVKTLLLSAANEF